MIEKKVFIIRSNELQFTKRKKFFKIKLALEKVLWRKAQ